MDKATFSWLEELTAYYRGALGLIVPSVCYETFGIILIESFRLGTPVIARRLGPFPEIVEKAMSGNCDDGQELMDEDQSSAKYAPLARVLCALEN